jgi:hypothetical protein
MTPGGWFKLEIVLVSSAIAILGLTFLTPVYSIKTVTGGGSTSGEHLVTEYYFDRSKVTYLGSEELHSYDHSEIGRVLAVEKLAWASSLFLVWAFLIAIIVGRDALTIMIGWMAMVTSVIAIAYPVVAIPGALDGIDGFYGASQEASWAPAMGWYLSLVSGVFVLFVALRRMNQYFTETREKTDEDWSPPDEAPIDELLR